ncbi:MAG: hypothetical protein ABIU54_13705 [Candidatus Eisenbacteria bacterium]
MRYPLLLSALLLICFGGASANPATQTAPVLTSGVRPNVAWQWLESKVTGSVVMRVRIDTTGIVDSVVVREGDPRLRSAATDAARWHLYSAPSAATWVELSLAAPTAGEAEALSPDPVAIALEAERAGDLQGAIEGWTGAIARVGRHPSLQDDHAIRAHILALAQRMPHPPAVPDVAAVPVRGAKNLLERSMASAVSLDALVLLDESLAIAPWYGEAYRWRAAALAGCGRIDDARRAVMLYRMAADDSASRAMSRRALTALAHADSIGAAQILKF